MLKGILKNWHRYVVWAILSAVFWAWAVLRVTDALPKNKVVLYADLYEIDRPAVEQAVEPALPEGIRFMEVDLFEDMLFSPTSVLTGDLYLVPESKVAEYLESFLPIDRSLFPGATFYESEGEAYGVCVYDEAAGVAVAGSHVLYFPGQRCYLFLNRDSRHVGAGNENSYDDAAIVLAQAFMNIE